MEKIEMNVDSINESLVNYQRTLILKEKAGKRVLVIFFNADGADAVKMALQKVPPPAHLTDEFICSIITRLGATLKHIVIDRLVGDTFYSKAILERGIDNIEVECRPSDAIPIALRAGVTIYATDEILSKAGVFIENSNACY